MKSIKVIFYMVLAQCCLLALQADSRRVPERFFRALGDDPCIIFKTIGLGGGFKRDEEGKLIEGGDEPTGNIYIMKDKPNENRKKKKIKGMIGDRKVEIEPDADKEEDEICMSFEIYGYNEDKLPPKGEITTWDDIKKLKKSDLDHDLPLVLPKWELYHWRSYDTIEVPDKDNPRKKVQKIIYREWYCNSEGRWYREICPPKDGSEDLDLHLELHKMKEDGRWDKLSDAEKENWQDKFDTQLAAEDKRTIFKEKLGWLNEPIDN